MPCLISSSRSRRACASASLCCASRTWDSLCAFCAPSRASRMLFSRSSIARRRGPQPNFASTAAKRAKRTIVQIVRPRLTSARPPPPPSAEAAGMELLEEDEEHGHDEREEGHALDEPGGHDHGSSNVAGGVGLAGDPLHGGG